MNFWAGFVIGFVLAAFCVAVYLRDAVHAAKVNLDQAKALRADAKADVQHSLALLGDAQHICDQAIEREKEAASLNAEAKAIWARSSFERIVGGKGGVQ